MVSLRPAPPQALSGWAGTPTRTAVPASGALVTVSHPPTSAARLRIESRPKCPGCPAAGSKPSPLSRTSRTTAALLSLDANVRGARLGVLLDIRERLPPDGEQLCLHSLGQREPRSRSRTSMVSPVESHAGGVPGERRDQPFMDRVAVQREDELAYLPLHAPGQVRDRAEGSSDAPGGLPLPPAPEPSAPCVCAEPSRTGPEIPNRGDLERSGAVPPPPACPRFCVLRRARGRIAPARSPRRSGTASSAPRPRCRAAC